MKSEHLYALSLALIVSLYSACLFAAAERMYLAGNILAASVFGVGSLLYVLLIVFCGMKYFTSE